MSTKDKFDKLNLGSGGFRKNGYINVDKYIELKPDILHDLDSYPWPFKDNTFSVVEANHVLEHLIDPFRAMREIHRISKDGAKVIVRVPHFSRGFTHADHKRGFDITFPYYFKSNFMGGYQGVDFDLEKVKLRWFAQPYLKKTVLKPIIFYMAVALGRVIDFFANFSPEFCSRFWCFLVGGFEEIEFHFRVKKLS